MTQEEIIEKQNKIIEKQSMLIDEMRTAQSMVVESQNSIEARIDIVEDMKKDLKLKT